MNSNYTTDSCEASSGKSPTPHEASSSGEVDLRQATYDVMSVGTFAEVQKAKDEIKQLNTIAIDLDPDKLRASALLGGIAKEDPAELYEETVKPLLSRDPILAKAEVRDTGTGLHVLLHLAQPVEFRNTADREKWSAIVEIVQSTLPADPNAPGMTMATRPNGSFNGKNGRTVGQLATGEPVSADEVIDLADRMRRAPFKTVLGILTGRGKVKPCPICECDYTLIAYPHSGHCYHCGKADLARLLDVVYADGGKEVGDG